MKKSLLALAVLGAFAGVAQAQTSVTIYGSFDAGVRYQNNQDAAGHSRLTMGSNGTYNSNRIGFKGVEDLGGGLNAHFTLESGFNSGTGALDNSAFLFQRSAFVGLGSQWGSLDLGRQYTVAFKTVGAYDPFNYKFTGIIPLTGASVSAGTRQNNDIQYTGTFGPITARAEWALGEQAGSARNGSTQGLGVTYANGPISVGGAYTLRKPQTAAPVAATATAAAVPAQYNDNRDWTVGGAYTFGPARVALGYAKERQDLTAGSFDQKNWWIGGSYDITPAMGLTAAYYDTRVSTNNVSTFNGSGKRQLVIVGATYALSKRTNFYADIDYARYSDALRLASSATAAPNLTGLGVGSAQMPLFSSPGNGNQTGVSVGINHLF
ncbi:porin [Noviherbaspirillum pedocola]|uniref:Porin n=1 Tax=Noviherbaspirillum pedocola TaxID=2801341 RepID=A0A934SXJ2_9BURK|nr:porin [Noviherbaspirillum pedocola]MBK4734702.1 porin [Noviherbaspirillum pedocola]